MIPEKNLLGLAQKIAKENDFELNEMIYKGLYYSSENIRSVIFDGCYKDKQAVLKIYDDPRLTVEGPILEDINRNNRSSIILAPQLYAYKLVSANQGWTIMEKLPEGGNFLKSPLEKKQERNNFLKLFLEYKEKFPQKPCRSLCLAEELSASEFHCFRISRWFELANKSEANLVLRREKPLLNPKEFIPLYKETMEIIRSYFRDRKMAWCAHGHFFPVQAYKTKEGKYYLVDFSHAKMYPEGYELAFIIWSDWIMRADWHMDYNNWAGSLIAYWSDCEQIALKIDWKLTKADIMERIIGAILADVVASDMAREEKEGRLSYLIRFLKYLIVR